ncbi:MAG: c-type cytochrome [Deltaproteobacteria bacterium]|nr:c-type cytochrome [Deltaproteobacteria bacterium]
MKSNSCCKFFGILFLFVIPLLMLAISTSPLQANGKDHHQPDAETSKHMQSMTAIKKEIPEEYRIMERTPILPSEKSLRQGHELFVQNCSVCHGEKGNGKGPAAAALKTPPANFLDKKHSAIYGPGEKYWIIGNGTGKTGMPAFSQFSPLNRWDLVNFILQLQ